MGNEISNIETNYHVRSLDAAISIEEYRQLPPHPLYIVLDNLRSAFNVGAIFRTCDALRVAGLFLCGYTAYPPHDKLQKTSQKTVDYVPWKHFEQTCDAVKYLKDQGIAVWAAETTDKSLPYNEIKYPSKLGIVFGNEALGINKKVIELCDKCIEVPMFGFKNSLNVATSCGILGYRAIEEIKKAVPDRGAACKVTRAIR